ncbi:MAG TPA: hypothetical protein VNV43_14930 [Candidatus Acidoferrales bacterium]|nr:hypothetical protein [Candidatus Acidoferrales bacterium]
MKKVLIHCKIHTLHCGIHFAKSPTAQKWANQTSIVMTTQESKLAKELERRLQDHALQNKNKVFSSEIKPKTMDGIVRTPLRVHHQIIQRAQFYTGDA